MKALTPLRYCELITVTSYGTDQERSECPRFASELVEGLACCEGCAVKLRGLLDEFSVELVDAPMVTAEFPEIRKLRKGA